MLSFDVPELVDRARLSQNAVPVGIGEEAHEPPRQLAAHRKPNPDHLIAQPLP